MSAHTTPINPVSSRLVSCYSLYSDSTPDIQGSYAATGSGSKQKSSPEPKTKTNIKTKDKHELKRKASQAFAGDEANGARGSKFQKINRKSVVASHEESRALLGIAETIEVNIDGRLVPLVPVPDNQLAYNQKKSGGGKDKFVRNAITCLLQLPGFKFTQYSIVGLQEMAGLIYATIKHRITVVRQMYRFIINFFPMMFREMLSQRGLYALVTNDVTKRAFFLHIHQTHYSLLDQNHNRLRKPKSRAKPNLKAESWAGLEADVLVKVIEAVVLAREAFLQDLAGKRNVAVTAQAGINLQNYRVTGPSCSSTNLKPNGNTRAGIEAAEKVKQEPGLSDHDLHDLGFKPEPDDLDDTRLDDIPEFRNGDDDDGWLNDIHSEDEESLPGPPAEGRKNRAARKEARLKFGELRTRNAVDCWIRFVRVELGRSEDNTCYHR